ncbi:MAG: hypothetical protein JSS89_12130 [Bacteroidetes bacterium]|nr:hypothetical protein [Bacteroidota bacterium]
MKKTLTLIFACLCICDTATSQTFISAKSMSAEAGLSSSLFPRDEHSWYVLRNVKGQQKADIGVLENWRIKSPSTSSTEIPFEEISMGAATFSNGTSWIGMVGKLGYSTDLSNWKEVELKEDGRELKAYALSPADGIGVLASISSYVVLQADTNNGVVFKRISDIKNRLELITPESRRVLYQDSGRRDPFTIGINTSNGGFAVGFGRYGTDSYYMAIIGADLQARLIEAPSNMPAGVAPTHLHRASNGDIYCFYGASSVAGRLRPPFYILYHTMSNMSEYVQMPLEFGFVSNAANFGGQVICATNGGILAIKDKEFRRFQLTDGQSNLALSIFGLASSGNDTLLAVAPEGIVVLPASFFTTTSIKEPSPGRIVNGDNSIDLEHFFSGHEEVQWLLYDNNGRLLSQGTSQVGQTDLNVPLGNMISGSYSIILTTPQNTFMMQRLMFLK